MTGLKHLIARLFGRVGPEMAMAVPTRKVSAQDEPEDEGLSPWLKALVTTRSCCI